MLKENKQVKLNLTLTNYIKEKVLVRSNEIRVSVTD